MSSPIKRKQTASAPLPITIQVKAKETHECNICGVTMLTRMIFLSMYDTKYDFCSKECLSKHVYNMRSRAQSPTPEIAMFRQVK